MTHPLEGGFSFGAWIAMQLLMRRPEIMGFVSISPPANNYDFSFLAPCTASGLIVQGNKDTIVPEEHPAKLAEKLSAQKNIEIDYWPNRLSLAWFGCKLAQKNQRSFSGQNTNM